MKVHSLFYTTQLQESVYLCDALKRYYQFLEALHVMMYCHCKYTKTLFMHSVDFVINIKLSAMEHPRQWTITKLCIEKFIH